MTVRPDPKETADQADDDARYFWRLINENGVPLEIAVRMVAARVAARANAEVIAEAIKPPKEPWQQ